MSTTSTSRIGGPGYAAGRLTFRTLASRIVFHVGAGYASDGTPIGLRDMGAIRRECVAVLSKRFGGCTLTEHEGGWIDPAGAVLTEPGFTLTVYTRDMHDQGRGGYSPGLMDVCRDILRIARQSAIVVAVSDSTGTRAAEVSAN